MTFNLGINASRARSGGAVAHLVGLIKEMDPRKFGIDKVHVWSYPQLLDQLPQAPWLVKSAPAALSGSLLRQLWWERFSLTRELRKANCALLLNLDAGSVCRFRPAVTMSRDMLAFESKEMRRYGFSKARLRLILLRHVQARAMRRASGVVFLTKYASQAIQRVTGELKRVVVIPHGVSDAFRQETWKGAWPKGHKKAFECLYVSNAEMYKHQWVVVRAIGKLRSRGHDVLLTLAGGGSGRAQDLLLAEIARTDPGGRFVQLIGAVHHDEIPALLVRADLFVFSSSCENMPNTLLEAMASALPIACSNRGPMPEILDDGGVYFDPEDAESTAAAVENLIVNAELRVAVAQRACDHSMQYSWARCAQETCDFLRLNYEEAKAK